MLCYRSGKARLVSSQWLLTQSQPKAAYHENPAVEMTAVYMTTSARPR